MSVRVRSLSLDRFHLLFVSFGTPLELCHPERCELKRGKDIFLRQFFNSHPFEPLILPPQQQAQSQIQNESKDMKLYFQL